jgi:glycosyltransferase involved in cell wall biosynthesis
MLYLRNLYTCPFVGYYELLPPPFWSEAFNLRKDFPASEQARLGNATYHALTYLHMHAVDAIYTPTHYQLSTAPVEMRGKFRVIFDGVDTEAFQRRAATRPAELHGIPLGPQTRVVTYVSRGLEAIRGFDIFMKVAKRIYEAIPDVVFLIAGDERTNYGHEKHHIGQQTFKQYVLSQDSYDLSKFHFLGLIPTAELPVLYSLSDLHIYLTVPYVLSWSLVQAMATECTILSSATAPVEEVIDHNVHGLLAGFDDIDALVEQALRVLRAPHQFRHLGRAARTRVLERYEASRCIGQLVNLFEEVVRKDEVGQFFASATEL